jgi:hypothetical protein
MLRGCLGEKEAGLCVLTTKQHLVEGVYRLGADFAEAKYKSVVRYLVDSDSGFTNDSTQHTVIYAVSVFVI